MMARERANILLVDDQPARLLSYEAMLADLGDNLIKAESGREALDQLLRNDITVILMDVSMPELDGFELAKLIRQHPRYEKTAIIFVSGVHITDFDRLRGYESGAVDYVSVPVVPEILRAKVSVFTELYRKRMELERLTYELEERVAERTSRLEAYATRLRENEDKMRDADRRKDEFLALLAHELRNPLAPLHNAIEIMRLRGDDQRSVTWCRDVIERQVNQLTRLVDDLLDVSRITRGKINLQLEPLDLATVIAGAVETSRPLLNGRRHELTVSLPARPILVEGDVARLTQVVANLLNNAAKYQNDGGRVSVSLLQDGSEAVISVMDGGIGIEPGKLRSVFELFSQDEAVLDRAQGGLGIGLWLVKTLVSMHGGRVAVHSEGRDRGSEFTIQLPCLTATVPAGAVSDADAATPLPPLRILVVDDNRDAADSLAVLLHMHGHDVLLAHDGPAAVEVATAEAPAVILLDIGMPDMDGYEVCRAIRERGQTDTFIVAVTGYGQERDRQRSRDFGFDAHAVKPVDPGTLARLLADSRRQTRAAVTGSPAGSATG